ncbi:MAG: PHP domain-containing protein [Dehalococcoidales bacterium]|nr:PHP domain-containing protein [Dehalococcoidales bacterium]
MSRVDLHIHSTASDGRFSPEAIVHKSAERGLTIIAIADHDSVDGIVPALVAAKAFPQLRVIPCVEISTDVPHGEVHVLGYFIDYTSHELKAALMRLRNSRRERAQGMIAKLRNLGIHIDWHRVQEIAGSGSIGRPHIAQAMLEKGYITSFKEAFTKYLNQGGPAYVKWEKMTPVEAVELILRANGLPVLAHPLTINDPEMMIVELKAAGLIGIEAYYDGYSGNEISRLVSLASRHNLIATGGSDYHGLDSSTETMIGDVDMPMESAERLIALAEQRH